MYKNMPPAQNKPKEIAKCDKPFKLEPTKYTLKEKQADRKKLLYTQNVYNPKVKITDWYDRVCSFPFDHDPYNPLNLLQSHYDRFGDETCFCYTTTTSEMLRQHTLKDNFINKTPFKRMLNYFSFSNISECGESTGVPEVCVCDYKSTMQDSYSPPYPYIMKHLSIPKVPALSTKRAKTPDPTKTSHKFYDEDYEDTRKYLQCHKSFRHNSYNFCTNTYQNGTLPPQKKPARVRLEY